MSVYERYYSVKEKKCQARAKEKTRFFAEKYASRETQFVFLSLINGVRAAFMLPV